MTWAEVTVRQARLEDAPTIAAVHVDSWHTTYLGLFPQSAIDAQTVERRLALWTHALQMPSAARALYVAASGDEVVGFASVGAFRCEGPSIEGEGELHAIYLRRDAQRSGIGRKLFDEGARWLRRAAFNGMRCRVVRGNPASAFYQRLGGQVVSSANVELEGHPFVEDCYRFDLDRFDLSRHYEA